MWRHDHLLTDVCDKRDFIRAAAPRRSGNVAPTVVERTIGRFLLQSNGASMNFFSERRIASLLVPLIWFLAISAAVAEPPYHIEWDRQLGGSGDDRGASVAVDTHGNSYLSGITAGSFGGTTNLGLGDT